jgi:hypothetical protein
VERQVVGRHMYRNGLQLDKGFDDEGSAGTRGRRLGVEFHGDVATAVERLE